MIANINLAIPQTAALVLFVLSLPVCVWVAWSDMKAMRIPNKAVLALVVIFVLVAPFTMPLETMGWQMLHLVVILLIGIVINAAGLVGAGDAKFAAAAAPYVALGDLRFMIALFAACLLAGYTAHRIAKFTPLRRMAPDWESWSRKRDFPMGLPLASTLSIYLLLGALGGA
ncbi:prepilin peptidase [Thalassobius sp. S69A]|uniref:prepilin peptidase n=1 Tax=unclassified Thalassovita TaxID=2619711 RepID=UPI003C7D74A2